METGKKVDEKYFKYLEYGLFILAAAAAYLVFMHPDLRNTIDNSNIFLSAIKNGKLLSFYEYSVEKAVNRYSANYNLMIYIIFGIWQAPMLILTRLLGKDYVEWSISLAWSKLLLVLFMFAVAVFVYKIVLECAQKKERALLAVYLYFTSVLVFFPVLICCQLEVVATFFMLVGLYYYLKGNMLFFWLAFLISVPIKGFGLLMALPLLLLKEKNLLKVFAMLGSMMSLVLIEKLIYRNSVVYKYALQAQNDDVIEGIMGTAVDSGQPVIFWAVCYLALLIWVYSRKEFSKAEVLFVCCYVWNTYMGLCYIRAYWVFFAGPFSVMSLCVNDRFLRTGILVEALGSFCYFLRLGAGTASVSAYNRAIDQLLLPHLMDIPRENLRFGNYHKLFVELNLTRFAPLFATVYVTSLLAIVVLTAPSLQKGKKTEFEPDRLIMILRPVLLIATVFLFIYGFTATKPPVILSTAKEESYVFDKDLISDDGSLTLSQRILVSKETETDEITLKFSNPAEIRANMSILTVQLADPSNGEVIAEAGMGCCKITNDKEIKLKLKGGKLEPGREYEIRLSALEGVETLKKQTELYPYLVKSGDSGMAKCTFNGEELDGSLYFILR